MTKARVRGCVPIVYWLDTCSVSSAASGVALDEGTGAVGEGFVVARLAAAGITQVEALGLDTYADADRFYSYRRATHRGEPGYGRQLSLIALAE